ncbi:MAG: tRNA lysidine(34) synthetase TilS [Prevotellaceae bacterium]|nr:tRNA lysidine(34) synthetase TilS [Prevotellaceae bacterium]
MKEAVLNKEILNKEKTYLVAVSGGADSVALLLMMHDEGYKVEAVHCNFHLRGSEADRDEEFVAGLCGRMGIKLHRVHFDTREYAELHKQSIETAARNLRYAYFENLRRDIGAEAIVVAHHSDDNVETVLMNLTRGTGLNGMAGIRAVNGHILRPLLNMSRRDIENYLLLRHQDYVTDSTNLETDATRNKFRLEVIPLLHTINPSASRCINATARHLQEAGEIVDWALDMITKQVVEVGADGIDVIDTEKLRQLPAPRYVLHHICSSYGFTPQQSDVVFQMMENGTKGKAISSATHDIAAEKSRLLVASSVVLPQPLRMPVEGVYMFGEGRIRVEVKPTSNADSAIAKSPDVATLDAATLTFPLTLRPWHDGDRFTPFGMKGSKLVSDYLTDRKKNYFERRRQLVVEDAKGTIVWLVGERTSEKCRITATTKEVVRVESCLEGRR